MAELKGISSDFSTGGECQDCYFKFIQYDLTPTDNEKLEETTLSLNLPVSEIINIVGSDFASYSKVMGYMCPMEKQYNLWG